MASRDWTVRLYMGAEEENDEFVKVVNIGFVKRHARGPWVHRALFLHLLQVVLGWHRLI